MQQSFIGITDFTNAEQVSDMRAVLDDCRSTHALGVGVMTSYKLLNNIPTEWSKIAPRKELIEHIFLRTPGVMNVLHYADYDDMTGTQEIDRALYWAGIYVDAIQFDMIWPSVALVARAKERSPGVKAILQVGRQALARYGNSPLAVSAFLAEYRRSDCLDYVLLDQSGGEGKTLDPRVQLSYLYRIRQDLPDVGLVVAGGLGPDTMSLIEPLAAEFKELSCDAQGRLRPEGKGAKEAPVDWDRAARYLREASARLSDVRVPAG